MIAQSSWREIIIVFDFESKSTTRNLRSKIKGRVKFFFFPLFNLSRQSINTASVKYTQRLWELLGATVGRYG